MDFPPLRVVLIPERAGGRAGYVAKCLDFELVAQGKTIQAAQESFVRVLRSHIALADEAGEPAFAEHGWMPKWKGARKAEKCIPAKLHESRLKNLRIAYSQLGKASISEFV